MQMRTFVATLVSAVLLSCGCAFASANTLVIPNGLDTTTGNASEGLSTPSSFEYQEDFGRGQFASVGGPLLITQIAFRAAPGTGPIDVTVGTFSIYLSTSPYYPNTINGHQLITSNYAANKGPDNTLVLSGGPSTFFSSPGCLQPGPCPFDMVFNLSTPFVFNPHDGTLLMDVLFTGWTDNGAGSLDAERFSSSLASVTAEVSASDQVDLGGPIVQIGFTPVPEPASMTLLATGLAAISFSIRRKLVP